MKKQRQSFRKLLMLSPIAIMLMSASVQAQDFLSEKQIAEGVISDEVIITSRGPSVIGSIEKVDENEVQNDAEVEALKKQLAEKQVEVDELKIKLEENEVATSEEIATLELVISSAEREISALQVSVAELEMTTEAHVSEKVLLEEKASALMTELEALKLVLVEQEEKVAALDAEKLKLEEEKLALEEAKLKLEEEKLALEEEKNKLQEENDNLVTVACEQEDRLQSLEEQVSQSANMPSIMQSMMMMQQQNMMFMMNMMNSGSFNPSMTSGYGGDNMHSAMMLQSMQTGMQNSLFQNSIYSMIGMQNNMRPTYQIAGDYINGSPYSTMNYGQQGNPAAAFNPESLMGINNPFSFNTSANFGNIQGFMAPTRPLIDPAAAAAQEAAAIAAAQAAADAAALAAKAAAATEAEAMADLEAQANDINESLEG
jgi:hypothetical protein